MNESFILLGCNWENDLTSSLMFSVEVSLLHRSLLIFINARDVSLASVMVDLRAVFSSFNWLKLLSLSQEVIGKVNAILRRTFKLG